MTAWDRLAVREAIVLPLLYLATAAGGGFRTSVEDGTWRFLPPTPMALVLGLLLTAVLVRTGVLVPLRLIGPQRSGLANANGAMVLGTLLLASAQVFTCLMPESGLLAVLASVFFLLLILNTLAARPDRARAMQSLAVVLLSAFVLKYVMLDALYAPEGSLARRVVTSLLEGVSLGALGYAAHGPATAYVAFVVILLYLFSLVLLPGDDSTVGQVRRLRASDALPASDALRASDALPASDAVPVSRAMPASDAPLVPRDPADR